VFYLTNKVPYAQALEYGHKKTTTTLLGLVKIEIPFEEMKWAKPGATYPSQIFKVGDVVQVKILKKENNKIIASLEQEPQIQGALYSLDVHSGQVLAMEGGFSFEKSEFNRATQAQRQTGSSYKPIIFSAAIEKGYTPASIIIDSPIVYDDTETGKWKPANYDEKFEGDILLRHALIKSRNIPTIKFVQAVQIPYLIDFSKRLGMTNNFNPDLSIALGSFTTSLEEMTKLYSVFPRAGRTIKPKYFTLVKDRDGKILEDTENKLEKEEQVLDPKVAYVATYLMKEVVNFGTGVEAKKLERPVAGKTGTTNDYMDAWFMGFTPDIVTGVWVGYDTLKPVGHEETGAKASLPIWLEYMKEAVKSYPNRDFDIPPGIVFETINPSTGEKASTGVLEAFIEGSQPSIKPQLIVGSLNDKNLTSQQIVTDQNQSNRAGDSPSQAPVSPKASPDVPKNSQNSGNFLKEDLE
jgi:penicillin-binding protein 1A